MNLEEFETEIADQLTRLLRLVEGANYPGYLVKSLSSGDHRKWDPRSLLLNAQAIAEKLGPCADESAASKVLQQDQENTRVFFVWAIAEAAQIADKTQVLEEYTSVEIKSGPYRVVSKWILDTAHRQLVPQQRKPKFPGQ